VTKRDVAMRRVLSRCLRSDEPGIFFELKCGHYQKRRPRESIAPTKRVRCDQCKEAEA